MDKIVLIHPQGYSKYPGMPMGLIHTATNLEQVGSVMAIDLVATQMSDDQLCEFVIDETPSFVLIGGTSPTQPEAYHIAQLVKNVNNQITVIKGGPHELFYPLQTAKHNFIDFVLSDDGENAPLLVERIRNKKQREKVFYGGVSDLSNTPLPNRRLLYTKNPSYYDFLDKSTAQIRMSRGCTFNCTYCSQGEYREYSDEHVYNDLEKIKREGFEAIYWDDANFTLNRKKLDSLLSVLAQYDFEMGCITRAGINTDLAVFDKMKSVGFKYIWFALESGDERIRESFGRKDVGTEMVKEAVYNAKNAGLITFVNIIIGSVCESDTSIRQTINSLNNIRPHGVSASVLTVYPGMHGCTATTYEKRINRDKRLMIFDEGYGGNILIDPGLAEKWYYEIKRQIGDNGIKLLDFDDCKTPRYWDLPSEL